MSYISYSPSQDPYNAIFRILALLEANKSSYEVDRIFIYDLFICFPWLAGHVEGIQAVKGFTKARNLIRRTYVQGEYEQIPEPWIILQRMRPAQLAALNSISSYGLTDIEQWKSGIVIRTRQVIPIEIQMKIDLFVSKYRILFDYIFDFLNQFEMRGASGLKAKTGLEEYRYDHV